MPYKQDLLMPIFIFQGSLKWNFGEFSEFIVCKRKTHNKIPQELKKRRRSFSTELLYKFQFKFELL